MKKKKTAEDVTRGDGCFQQHDFFQVSDGSLTAHTLGQLGSGYQVKPPRFICRKCGKVIQL